MAVKFRAVSTVTNTDGVSASSVTVNKPTGTVEGDILILVTHGYTGDTGMAGVDAQGFELLDIIDEGSDFRSRAWKKIATSSEPASYTVNFGGAGGAVGCSLASFAGGHDVLTWSNRATTTTDPAVGYDLDAARDSVGWQVYCWRNDTANTTVSWSFGAEKHDITAKATSAIRSGQSGMYYGPPDLSDIVNAGDELPAASANPATAPLFGVFWNFLVGDKEPDNETWSETDGDFAVDVKLDRVEIDDTGSVETLMTGDVTGVVAAVAASSESEAAANAADGLPLTNWLDDVTAAPQWLRYDFGVGVTKTVRRYRIRSAEDGSTYGAGLDPMTWTLDGSQDASSWTTLDSRSGETFGARGEAREFRVTTPGAYRYYRLNVTVNFDSAAIVGCQLAEFRLSTVDVWEDITTYVNEEDKIRITRGFQGAAGRSDFSRAYFSLNNTDGRFSLRNPNSPYHGALQRNSEVRISKAYGEKSLQLQGAVQVAGVDKVGDCFRAPLTYALAVTSEIDIRLDLDLESWHAFQSLAGMGLDSNAPEHGWGFYLDDDGRLNLDWVEAGGTVYHAESTIAVPDAVRQSVRVTMDPNNGASGNTVTFYTAGTFNGTWVQLGEPVVQSGITNIFYAGGSLCIGHSGRRSPRGIHGKVYNFELRDGIAGTLVADLDFTAMDNGTRTYTDSNDNEWIAINYAVVSNRRYRFHGEVAEWPLAWDTTGTWIWSSVTAAGVQKRLERGSSTDSTMRRYHTKGIVTDPGFDFVRGTAQAYWPMEDGKNSYRVSSGLSGLPHMEVYGAPEFGTFTEFNESAAILKLNGSKLGATVVGSTVGYTDLRFMLAVPETIPVGTIICSLWMTGTLVKHDVVYTGVNTWDVRSYTEADLETAFSTQTGDFAMSTVGELMHVRILLTQSGSDIAIDLDGLNTVGEDLGGIAGTLSANQTLGRLYRVQANDNGLLVEGYMGHMAVYGEESPTFTDPINSYHYERAANRIERICAEEEIEYRQIGAATQSTFMGFQNPDSPQAVMSSASNSDLGYLVDPLDAFGIEFRTGRSLFNQAARLTLSYTGNELSGELQPVSDDGHLVNDQTVSRGDAGSARFRLTEGPLSVNPPPSGVGEYAESQSYSLAHEGQCVDLASFLVAQGTLDEDRYPRIEVALENIRVAADSALIEAILDLDVGQRLDIVDTREFFSVADIRQIAIGYEEWFDNFQHNMKINTVPERVFESAQYNTSYRFDVTESQLYADIDSTETAIEVQAATGAPWTIDPAAIPIDVMMDGERMRITAVGRLISSNPFFDSDSTGWSAGTGSVARSTTYVHHYDQAVASLLLTPDGVGSFADAINANSAVGSVEPLRQYEASAWVYSPDGDAATSVSVFWRTSAGTFISTSSGTDQTIPAGVWTHVTQTFQAPATASIANMRVRVGGTPAANHLTYLYSVRLIQKTMGDAYTLDSFNRTASTTNLGSTDDGVIQAWVQNSGTWGVISNTAYTSSAAAGSIATVAGTADFERLSVTMSTWTSGDASLVFRFTDTSNYCRWGGTVGSVAELVFVVAGVATRTELSSVTLAAGDLLSVRCNGSVVECFVDDVMVLCVSETDNQSGTRVGMRTGSIVPRFNNFTFVDVLSPQSLTVVRGVDGVSAPHQARVPLSLYNRPYRAL
jgi:hypothetical protein